MTDSITIGLAQWHAVPGDAAANLQTALALIEELAAQGSDLIVLPELWASGYDAGRLAAVVGSTAEPVDGPRGHALAEAARRHQVWLLAGTVPESAGGRTFNTAVLYDRSGQIAGSHRKAHLYLRTGEDSVFAAGETPTVIETTELGTIGVATCFDGDHPGYARALRTRGARLVLMPTAYEVGAERWWDLLYPANALANGQWWVMVNQCGGEGSAAMFGRSRVISPSGVVVHEAPGHDEAHGPYLATCTIDFLAELRSADAENAALWEDARPEIY